VRLLAVVRDGKPIQNPDDGFVFQKGDMLILIGNHADIDAALGVLGCEIVS
jgi:K+/H+ antiporter YhaU regulatory subunit KhtT